MKILKPIVATALVLILWFGIYAQTLSPTALTLLGPQAPISSGWFDTTEIERARVHGEACPTTPPTDPEALNQFILLQYYDLPLTEYMSYARTGDPVFLGYARKAADSWWKHPWINEGNTRMWPDSATPPPRHAGIQGLILRALDGRPEMWDWIVGYTQFHFDLWLKRRISDPQLYYGVREGAFILHGAAWLAKALPDSYPNAAQIRTQLLTDIEAVVVNYFGRLQQSDGSWRWDDFDTPNPDDVLKGITQPFMIGLLLNALVDVHRFTTNETVKASVKNQILKACIHLYANGPYRKDEPIPGLVDKRWRSFWYLYHGGTVANPTKYEKGGESYIDIIEGTWVIANERQSISTIFTAYGYAFLISGDPLFKTMGDELFDSAFGGSDGFRGMADGTAKNYNQNYRMGGRFLVWGGSAQPAPSPTPTSSPLPSPSPTPSATPTPEPSPSPAPCTLDVPASISLPPNSTGKIGVSLNSMTPQIDQFLVRAVSATPGQVSVFPEIVAVTGTSAVIEFSVRVKKRSAMVTFTSPCSTKTTVVMVR